MKQKEQIRIIFCDGGYRFFIYPAAYLTDQEIGYSARLYNSEKECTLAIEDFKAFVRSKDLQFGDEQYIKYEKEVKEHHERFGFYFMDDSGERFFESGFRYSRKQNCKNGIIGVLRTLKEFS